MELCLNDDNPVYKGQLWKIGRVLPLYKPNMRRNYNNKVHPDNQTDKHPFRISGFLDSYINQDWTSPRRYKKVLPEVQLLQILVKSSNRFSPNLYHKIWNKAHPQLLFSFLNTKNYPPYNTPLVIPVKLQKAGLIIT